MRIAIDCRRGIGSGMGRVTRQLAALLHQRQDQLVLYTGLHSQMPSGPGILQRPCPISYHSAADYREFPRWLTRDRVDLFFAPQYYISPFADCPTIKCVYDLWPLLHTRWVPAPDDFRARYGVSCLQDALHFLGQFAASPEGRQCIAANEFISRFLPRQQNPIAAYYAVLFLLAFQNAQAIVSPSRHTLQEIETVFPEHLHKVRRVPISPDPVFRPGDGQKRNLILHVANWEPRKNIEVLLAAFGLLRDRGHKLNLVLVGNAGENAYTLKIRRLIATHPHADMISHLGLVADDALVCLYQQASVFVCPSLYEGFGIPPLEAMACGTPVVCARAGALPEVCGAAALYFDPGQPIELCDRLVELLIGGSLRDRLVAAGWDRLGRFTEAQVRLELSDLVETLTYRLSA